MEKHRNFTYPINFTKREYECLTLLSFYNKESKAEVLRRLLHGLAMNANLMTLEECRDLEVSRMGRPPRKNGKGE